MHAPSNNGQAVEPRRSASIGGPRGMTVGLAGAGSIARALTCGLGLPVLCTDGGSGRARALAADCGGRALAGNGELAREADVVFLCHKPAQLAAVARELDGEARAIVSLLSGVTLAELAAAYPRTPVLRVAVNLPVAVRRGVIAYPGGAGVTPELEAAVLDLLRPLGLLVRLGEDQLGAAVAVSGVGPAYAALVAEAQVDAAVRLGLPAPVAARLAAQTLAGTGTLLALEGWDTLRLRRAVTSPGGTTARGLAALERGGLRAAFADAADAVAGAGSGSAVA